MTIHHKTLAKNSLLSYIDISKGQVERASEQDRESEYLLGAAWSTDNICVKDYTEETI